MVEMVKYVWTMAPWQPGRSSPQQTLVLVTTSWADLCTVYGGINTFILEFNNVPEYGQCDGQGWVLCPLCPLYPQADLGPGERVGGSCGGSRQG